MSLIIEWMVYEFVKTKGFEAIKMSRFSKSWTQQKCLHFCAIKTWKVL